MTGRKAKPAGKTPASSVRSLHDYQAEAEAHWDKTDKTLAHLSRRHPLPVEPHALTSDGFSTLVLSIVHQQVSMAAARTIQGRLIKLLGGSITPRRILNRSPEQLRSAGLSRAKAAYILDLADKTARGDVQFERFPDMDDEAILAELTAVKGIGTWTAKMFLMFHLHRPDVLAQEDLGLRMAVSEVYKVPPQHAAEEMLARRERWSPYCSVAARVLWNSRRDATTKA
ncbi:MAG TPA: DNA-3-methyladenine glycosylase 2 family protein [Candidatus Thermoplasmatota archaeon]|nr:DNA-3-methyladenine glycosylase 2 family protein [Candidatus Thermoplasmatota archaeon]